MNLGKYDIYIRYLISGGTAAAIDLGLLYLFTDIFNIYYLLSATMAFMVAFLVSFLMQKYWTFQERGREQILGQISMFFTVGLLNVGLNAIGMYVLVDVFSVMYLLAQVIMGGLIAIGSFLIYKLVIFKPHC